MLNFVKSYCCIYGNDHLAFSFNLNIANYIDFQMLNQPCFPRGEKTTCFDVPSFLYIAEFLLLMFFGGFLYLYSWRILVYIFFLVMYLPSFGISVIRASENQLGGVSSLQTSERYYIELILFISQMGEFTNEALWACGFLCWKVLKCVFNLFNRKRDDSGTLYMSSHAPLPVLREGVGERQPRWAEGVRKKAARLESF